MAMYEEYQGKANAMEETSIHRHFPAYDAFSERMRAQSKIFAVGLNKTGTTSLHTMLKEAGLRSLHDPYKFTALVKRSVADGGHMLERLKEYDAFSDCFLPFANDDEPLLSIEGRDRFFTRLFSEYPDMRYIVNYRSVDGWLASRERHVRRNVGNQNYKGRWTTFDEGWSRREHERHYNILSDVLAKYRVNHVWWNLDDRGDEGKVLQFLGMEDFDAMPHAAKTRSG